MSVVANHVKPPKLSDGNVVRCSAYSSACRGSVVFYLLFLVLYKLLIKLRLKSKNSFHPVWTLSFPAPPRTLEMNHFPGPEEFKGFSYLRVFNDADQVVIGGPGLLFCRQVLVKVRDGISLGLEFAGIKGHTRQR